MNKIIKMNPQTLYMSSINKPSQMKSLYSPSYRNAYPIKANLPNSPNQKSNLFVLNFLDKDKELKQKKSTNIFRKQLFSQNIKSPKKASDKNQINIKLNFNSEIINNNFNQHIDNISNYNSINSNSNSVKYKQKATQDTAGLSYEEVIKEKDKMISILQKELEANQAFLIKLHKEKEEAPLSLCESEDIDVNIKALTTKGSMNLTSSGKFNQLSSSNVNGLPSPKARPVLSPRCFSSSLNLDSDSIGVSSLQANSLLGSSLSLGKFKTMKLYDFNNPVNRGLFLSNQGKARETKLMKESKLRISSPASNVVVNPMNESLQSQFISLKERTKRLLESYYSIMVE